MNKEQLFDAIDSIDDKYVSETENFDPETMKIRVFPMTAFVPAALVAASVAAVVLAGYFKVHGNDPLGPEIDNNISTSITAETSDTSETGGTENVITSGSYEAVSEITGSYFTEIPLPVTDRENAVSASPDAGRVSSSPDSHTSSPSPVHTPATAQVQTSSLISSPLPTSHPVTGAMTMPTFKPEESASETAPSPSPGAPLLTDAELTMPYATMSPSPLSPPSPTPYQSPMAPTNSPSPANPPTGLPSPANPPTGAHPTGAPVQSGQKKQICSSYSEAKEYILNDSVFEELRSESYIYYPEMPDNISGQWNRGVTIQSSGDYEDAGIVRSASVNGCNYNITVYTADDYFVTYSSDMAEYLRKRSGISVYDEGDGKFFTGSISGDVYFFIDEDHYCKVSSDNKQNSVLEFAEILTFSKYDLY